MNFLSGKDNNFKNSVNTKNNIITNNTCNTTFYEGFNNMNKYTNFNIINESNDYNLNKTMYNFQDNKIRASSENKFNNLELILIYNFLPIQIWKKNNMSKIPKGNTKLVGSSLGYSSALIYPSNRFISKLDLFFRNYA